MSEHDTEEFWNIILKKFTPVTWDAIEEIEPDAIDLQMLKALENDPECHVFTKESDINWNDKRDI